MVRADTNEKITNFSKSRTLDHGVHVINVKNDKLPNYIWWKGILKPHEAFNPEKTKGFLVLRLLLYGYLNRITASRSNSDNALMYPYLKILLDNKEIYRTKILDSSTNVWDEKIEVQIHYIKSKIEIQLYDLDETYGVIEDEYIGSAIINVCDLQLSKKHDIIIKFINKKAILTDPHIFKAALNEKIEKKKEKSHALDDDDDNDDNDDNEDFFDEKKEFIDSKKKQRSEIKIESEKKKDKHKHDYNIRIFAKLVNKYQFSNSLLELNNISSLNYKFFSKTNEILDNDLNVSRLYEDAIKMKLSVDTIWLPFCSIICNLFSWKRPFYSIFFFFFLCFSIIFSKLFLSFFLISLSLIIFIFVSIIKESDDKIKSMQLTLLKGKKKRGKTVKLYEKKEKEKYNYGKVGSLEKKKKKKFQNARKRSEEFILNNSDHVDETVSVDLSSVNSSSETISSTSTSSSNNSSNFSCYDDDGANNMYKETRTLNIEGMNNETHKYSHVLKYEKRNKEGIGSVQKRRISSKSEHMEEEKTDENEEKAAKDEEDEDEEEEEEEEEDDDDDNTETDLAVVKTLISNVLDEEVIWNVKYVHFLLFSLIQISQNILNIFRKFGYLLVLLSWFLCILNIFFYTAITKLLRISFFLSGFVFLTYKLKPMNAVYRFVICSREYYSLKMKIRKVDIYKS